MERWQGRVHRRSPRGACRGWIAAATAALGCLAFASSADAASTYFVREGGMGTDCTQVDPCDTVAEALTAHRADPDVGDVIDVGPGTFVENVEADQPEDEGLMIRGALNGATRQTTLRGEGAGAFGYAVLLGGCSGEEVKLRDAKVDTVGADSFVGALSLDGGSDLLNVHASTQPGSDAFGVVDVCQRGTTIDRTEIVAEGDVVALNVFETVRLQDSTVSAENVSAINQFSGGDPNREMRIRRSQVSVPADSATPVVNATTRLTVDSSLITGGVSGLLTFEGVEWLINNSTIDPGEPGVSDPVNTQSLFLQPFVGSTAEVTVDSSILVDGIFGNASDGGDATVSCDFSDIAAVDLDPSFTNDCELGGGSTNTTTPPEDLFLGGAPYDWMLKAGSPAIDTGQPGAVPAGLAIRDLNGNPRRAAGTTATCPDPIRDKGAYELVGFPCNTRLPSIDDGANPMVGVKLGSSRGQWSARPTSHRNQWLRCEPADPDDCDEIMPYRSGHGTYRPVSADVGYVLRTRVIATNAAGDSDPARSAPSGEVTLGVPTLLQAPSIQGGANPAVGTKLNGSHGQWTGAPTSFQKRWLRCDELGDNCDPITPFGAGGYIPVADDIGHTLRVTYIATNDAGDSAPVTSAQSGVVSSPPG